MNIGKMLLIALVVAVSGGMIFLLDEGYFRTHQWNYRLTVYVETPAGVVKGTGVRAVQYERNFFKKDF